MKCSQCKQEATRTISIDIDIQPIYICDKEECLLKAYVLLYEV